MSYCRWSSDDHQCDLYVYGSDVGGREVIYIHVAARRVLYRSPLPERVGPSHDLDGWLARAVEVQRMVDEATRVPIGGPHDGQTFEFDEDDRAGAADLVEELIAAGYRAPAHVAQVLREEAAEPASRTEAG